MGEDQIYLYGVMAAGSVPDWDVAGIDGAEVYGLRCGEFGALVSSVQPESVDFQADAILAHERLLLSAMETGTVIPVAFGHLFATEAEICELLESAAEDLRANFDYLSGRVEVGFKATWRKEQFLPDIGTPRLRELMEQARHPGASPSLTLQVGELVADLVGMRRDQYVADICRKLEAAALEMRLNEPVTARMVFNAAFLIDSKSQDSFFQLVNEVAGPYGDYLEFHYSGPWPPHNFSRLHIAK